MTHISICWLTMSVLVVSALSGLAAEPRNAGRERVERLINQLASKNKPPEIISDPAARPIYPPDYDHESEKMVAAAEKELEARGKDVIPQLIEHSDDRRYSQTALVAFVGNVEVGEVCEWIIFRMVEPNNGSGYKVRDGADGKPHRFFDYFEKYYQRASNRKPGLQKWWLQNKHKSLRQIQIEILETKIEYERKVGFPTERSVELYLTPLLEQLAKLKQ